MNFELFCVVIQSVFLMTLIKIRLSAAHTISTVGPEEQGHMKSNLAVLGPGKNSS